MKRRKSFLFYRLAALVFALCLLTQALICCAPGPAPQNTIPVENTPGTETVGHEFPVQSIRLGDTDISEFTICYDPYLENPYGYMAGELRRYIAATCGAVLTVYRGVPEQENHLILLGPIEGNPDVEDTLGEDGIYIEYSDGVLHLTGQGTRGPVYAAFTFLEEYLGWRFFTKDLETCKQQDRIEIPEGLKYTYTPPFSFRQTLWESTLDTTYSAKRKLNVQSGVELGLSLPPRYGKGIRYVKDLGQHTFDDLITKNEYPDHPEYFADLVGDGSIPAGTEPRAGMEELCLTNPDVLDIVIEKVASWLRTEEDPRLISISQNDNIDAYCRCDNCRAQGTPTDNYLKFISKVADHFKDEYPDLIFEMLAYEYTQSPPSEGVEIPANVGIRLCSISTCAAHAFDEDQYPRFKNQRFLSDLKGWLAVCDNVSVWDYVTNFSYYLTPFPNFEIMRRNVRLHAEYGTRRLFLQGNFLRSGEFGELRAYLCAKLLWEPSMSESDYYRHMDEFLEAYYGEGGQSLRQYLALCETAGHKGNHFSYYTRPCGLVDNQAVDRIFDPDDTEFLSQAQSLWDQAFAAAKTDEQKERLSRSYLSFRYLKLSCDYKREWIDGDETQKRAYEESAAGLYRDILFYNVGPAEGQNVPTRYDPQKPPYTWTGHSNP